ncbi:hypothetical protein ACSQ67_005543 [Phaseolus vulgaris]
MLVPVHLKQLKTYGLGLLRWFTKRCESLNTGVSFLWWIVGFYWVVSGGDILLQDAPRLYWLAVVFLAFDVFFAIFCVVLACLIGIALCCCLPCIIAILYAVAGQEGASEADLSILQKYRFRIPSNEDKSSGGGGSMVPIETSSAYLATERILLPEDAECCICLCSYEDGAELHALPCNHHFHSSCIVKWLKMNATCPLCNTPLHTPPSRDMEEKDPPRNTGPPPCTSVAPPTTVPKPLKPPQNTALVTSSHH